jgi:hypothetical protein
MKTGFGTRDTKGNKSRTAVFKCLLISHFLLAALLSFPAAATVADLNGTTPDSDSKCLKCHSRGLKKSLQDEAKLSLQVTAADFQESVHSEIDCTNCHQETAQNQVKALYAFRTKPRSAGFFLSATPGGEIADCSCSYAFQQHGLQALAHSPRGSSLSKQAQLDKQACKYSL